MAVWCVKPIFVYNISVETGSSKINTTITAATATITGTLSTPIYDDWKYKVFYE